MGCQEMHNCRHLLPVVDFQQMAAFVPMDRKPAGLQHRQGLGQPADHQAQPGEVIKSYPWDGINSVPG